ncbi:MAG: glycosyltransferase family 2 protein [Hungatella sp.]|jgi:hypothetical protein|nr:glycosyltransferase family 2 protein [Hungatella sp.]MCI9635032.1 glycosyltransferase family 2 protein [Hungatella sp.]
MRAPCIVFVYNRLEHTKKCLESLSQAEGAKHTDLYIFSDGPKRESDDSVKKVRNYIYDIKNKNVFRKVVIIESIINKGLAASVIEGVNKIINEYGSCIVVEDDNIVTQDFLAYMNRALSFYEKDNIWSISGFSVVNPRLCKNDVYFLGRICSYAWATWSDRWNKVDWEISDYKRFRFDLRMRNRFNEFGTDRANMLDRQILSYINSWAIRFDFAEFEYNMFTVYPKYTKVKNIGNDGSGTHFITATTRLDVELPLQMTECKFIHDIEIIPEIKNDFCGHYGLRWQARTKRLVLREIEFLRRKICRKRIHDK